MPIRASKLRAVKPRAHLPEIQRPDNTTSDRQQGPEAMPLIGEHGRHLDKPP